MDLAASRGVVTRLGVFLLAVTFLNALDRTNVSFAALQMNRDLGFDSRDYGLGVGLFFLGFILFAFPGALLARRMGAVRALALMMIAWGSVSALMGAVQGKASFYLLRILLGMAEAAVTPLLLVYAGQWAPQRAMARAFSYLGLAFPLAFILNAPLSGWIITAWDDVAGLAGWRWMFILQGLPTVLLGLATLAWAPEHPAQARWLTDDQKARLAAELEADRQASREAAPAGRQLSGFGEVFADGRVWTLGGVLFSITTGIYGLAYWLPQVMAQFSGEADVMRAALLSALPWVGAAVGSLLAGRGAGEVRGHARRAGAALLLGAAGLAAGAGLGDARLALAGLVVGGFGLAAAQVAFTTVLPGMLRGMPAQALAFALINVVGSLAGLIGPIVIGWQRHVTGDFTASIYTLAAVVVTGGGLAFVVGRAWAAAAGVQAEGRRGAG